MNYYTCTKCGGRIVATGQPEADYIAASCTAAMINYTPHAVTVRLPDGSDIVYPPSGIVARVEMRATPAVALPDGCPTIQVWYGAAELPAGHTGPCIVSTMFADAYRRTERNVGELFVPDSGPSAIRKDGQIVAVIALIRR